jgi:DNA replication protein DnaC
MIWDGLETIPPIYWKLRPITPARGIEGRPFTVILGECGVGKSVTAAELVEHLARKTGFVPLWINVPELLLKIRSSFDKRGSDSEEKIIADYSGKRLLCLDDLAAEKVSEYSISTLYMILNRRGEYGRLTVVTSNLTLDGISQRLDDRIASRLCRYGNVITLTKCNVAESNGSKTP